MLVIRLRRIGKKNKPTYRVVVAPSVNQVGGAFTEDLGFYNPHTKVVSLKQERVSDWLNKGAKPSNTVAKILTKEKIKHPSVVVIKRVRPPKKQLETATPKTEPTKAEQPAAETPEPKPTNKIEDKPAEEGTDQSESVAIVEEASNLESTKKANQSEEDSTS